MPGRPLAGLLDGAALYAAVRCGEPLPEALSPAQTQALERTTSERERALDAELQERVAVAMEELGMARPQPRALARLRVSPVVPTDRISSGAQELTFCAYVKLWGAEDTSLVEGGLYQVTGLEPRGPPRGNLPPGGGALELTASKQTAWKFLGTAGSMPDDLEAAYRPRAVLKVADLQNCRPHEEFDIAGIVLHVGQIFPGETPPRLSSISASTQAGAHFSYN